MSPSLPILVLADDLSGAAELAGIAAARGLTAAVHRHNDCAITARVTAIDTDSRNSTPSLAKLQMMVVAHHALRNYPIWIFKKVDSLLRGNPRAEIESLMQAWGCDGTVLIPANPSYGRTISAGQYYIEGIPIHETLFADDPEYPRKSAHIDYLIPPGDLPIQNIRAPAKLPSRGIIVPDVESIADIEHWAAKVSALILPAGAADFFAAMLDRWCGPATNQQTSTSPPFQLPALLVCGSHLAWQTRKNQCALANIPMIEIGFPSTAGGSRLNNFIAVSQAFQTDHCLVLASGQEMIPANERASRLQSLAHTAALIVRQDRPKTLLLEGGATAAAVVSQLGWNRFSVQASAAHGVGYLRPIDDPNAPLVLIKPGSYPWPAEIWKSFCG